MSTPLTVITLVLLVLLGAEAIGTVVFTVLYYRGSDWRASAIGRHLLLYGIGLSTVYAATFAAMIWPSEWLGLLLIGAHLVFVAAVWQRVYLVTSAQRREARQED
jgi:hypothetical protein